MRWQRFDNRVGIAALFAGLLVLSLGPGAPAGSGDGRSLRARLMSKVEAMTLEEKIGQLFMTYAYGRSVEDPDPTMVEANRKVHGVDNFKELIERYHLGGIVYTRVFDNLQDPHQIAELSNGIQRVATKQRSSIPMLISITQEYGIVDRIRAPATQFPGNMPLGAARDPQLAYTAAAISGEELRAMGINQNYAPTADVNVNPANPVIGVRSFSSDPELVSSLTAAQVRGYQASRESATAKHFPGHGDTDVDSHTGLPIIHHSREELETIDFPPFEAAIDAGAESMMTAHIVVPALDDSGRPATLSKPIVTGVLRKDMSYDGVVVTDALEMAGVRQMFGDARVPIEAIKAGDDILLRPPDLDLAYNSLLEAVRGGEIGMGRINRSVYRILRMKYRLGLFADPFTNEGAVDATVGTPEHLAAADAMTEKTITLVKNDAGVLPLSAQAIDEALITGAGATSTSALGGYVEKREVRTEVFETGNAPSDQTIEEATDRARNSDVVVALTSRAWSFEPQQRLIRSLDAAGAPLVVVAVREPYDIAYFNGVDTFAATYNPQPVSMKALSKVLFGEVEPTGRLPVTIPRAGDANSVLYPFGHGLGY